MKLFSFLVGLGLVVAGVLLVAYGLLNDPEAEAPEIAALPPPVFEVPIEPQPTVEPSQALVVRIEVPHLDIDAPVVTLGVLEGGIMESPHTPTDVGWYRFSAQPGTVGNAVFAGHVDYANYGPAVFYRLRELKFGDVLHVSLADGSRFDYLVTSAEVYDADTAPVQQIVGPTENETITLITCTGVFDRKTLNYNERLVVKGERSSVAVAQ